MSPVRIINTTPFVFAPLVSGFRPPGLHATLVVKGTFQLTHDRPVTVAENQQQLSGDLYEDDDAERECLYDADAVCWKPRADAILLATCHSPGGRPVTRCRVSFTIGTRTRALDVVGDRGLHRFLFFRWTSQPKSFCEMPVRYRYAYGGPKWPWNPVGKGHRAQVLPNLESVTSRRRPKSDENEPVGFGPISKLWKSRMQRAGTYDRAWQESQWPWFPKDFDWRYFNAAPTPLQMDEYLRGDEELRFDNLHPAHPVLRAWLPGLRVRVLVSAKAAAELADAPMNLDTLFVDLDREMVILVWRGVIPVETEDLSELQHLLVVAEPLAEAPKPETHHRALLMDAGDLEASRPDAGSAGDAEISPVGELTATTVGPAEQDPSTEIAQADKELAKVEAAIEAALREQGIGVPSMPSQPPTFDQMRKDLAGLPAALAASGAQLPPAVQAEVIEFAKGDWLTALEADVAELETDSGGPTRWSRKRCEEHAASGGSFAAEDLSRLDLSGMNLAGVDLSQAILKGANLAGADLTGSNLTGAVLESAELGGAVLRGAILRQADLTRVRAAGADLTQAQMQEMDASDAVFDAAFWTGADASRAVLAGASFKDADLSGSILMEADLGRVALARARLTSSDLSGACLEEAIGPEVVMIEANLSRLKAEGADFSRGQFERAQAPNSLWDRATLDGADFSSARLTRASFGGAILVEARFVGVDMPQASFEGAKLARARLRNSNLFRGSLERADLDGADVRGANLYEVEFLGASIERARFEGANLKSTKLATTAS